MNGFSYRLEPAADPSTRRRAVLELRRLIESGRYRVSAEEVAEALLAEAGIRESDCSSLWGFDADAN